MRWGLLGVAWEWLSVGVCWLGARDWEIIDSLVMVVIVRFIVHINFFLVESNPSIRLVICHLCLGYYAGLLVGGYGPALP